MRNLIIILLLPCQLAAANFDDFRIHVISDETKSIINPVYVQKLRPESKTAYSDGFILLTDDYESTNPHRIAFKIQNQSSEDKRYILNISDLMLSDLTITGIRSRGDTLLMRSGAYVPIKVKDLNSGLIHAVSIDMVAGETVLVSYIFDEYVPIYGLEHVTPKVYSYSRWVRNQSLRNLWYQVLIGFLILQVMVGLSVYYYEVDRSIILYVAYVICLLGYISFANGLAMELFFPDNPINGEKITRLMTTSAGFFYLIFAKNFLKMKRINRSIDLVFRAGIGFTGLCVAVIVFTNFYPLVSFDNVVFIILINYIVLSFCLFFTTYFLTNFAKAANPEFGRNSVKIVVAAFLFLGVFVLYCVYASIVDGSTYTNIQNYTYGIAIETSLIAIALVVKMKETMVEEKSAQKALINQLTENEKLQRSVNEELEYKVKERTQQLEETTAALEESNQTKDKFFSIIAHDVKSPLISLKSLLGLITGNYESVSESVRNKALNELNVELGAVSKLLDNLLYWSLEQKDKLEVRKEPLLLRELLDEIKQINSVELGLKQIDMVIDVGANTHVTADKNVLNFIMRNLISNAIKFTPEGGRITLKHNQEKGSHQIVVSDTGVGIPMDELTNIFKHRHSTLGTNKEKGTGLGLSLSYEFAQKMGAELSVTSELNSGTTFILSL